MSDVSTHVPAFEHGRLRLYGLDTTAQDGAELVEALGTEPREAAKLVFALRAEHADPYWVDLVALKDIAEMGLRGYLRTAYEVPEEQIEAADLATGLPYVLIVPSKAFGDEKQTLWPRPYLTPLAEFALPDDVSLPRPMDPVDTAPQARAEPPAETPGTRPRKALHPGAILVLLVVAAAFIALVAL